MPVVAGNSRQTATRRTAKPESTLKFRHCKIVGLISGQGCAPAGKGDTMPSFREAFLQYALRTPRFTSRQIADAIGWPQNRVSKRIMEHIMRGRIRCVGGEVRQRYANVYTLTAAGRKYAQETLASMGAK